MAKALLQAPFDQVSGKFRNALSGGLDSGVVAMPGTSGQTYLRAMTNPVQPNTTFQLEARNAMITVAEAFQSLTLEQVQGWRDLSQFINLTNSLGQSYHPNWNNTFMMVNNLRVSNGLAVVLDAPAYTTRVAVLLATVTSDDGTPTQELLFNCTDTDDTAAGLVRIRISRATSSPTYQIPSNELRFPADPDACYFALGAAGATPQFNITSTRLNINAGDHIAVEVTTLNDTYIPVAQYTIRNITVGVSP